MKRMIQGLVLAGSLLVGGAAFAQGDMQGSTQGQTMAGKSMAKGGMVEHLGFMVPADPKAMLERLHRINQAQIQLGRLAQQNGMSQDVKSYGEMLVREHTSADEQLMSYAQQKGFKLAEPKPMNDVERKAMAAEKASMEKFKVLQGQPFDASFLAHMVGGHDMALGKLVAARENVTDAGLKPMLQQLCQTISQHRQQAYTLLGRIGPGATMGVGGSGDPSMGTTSPGDKSTMDPGSSKKY